MKRRLKGGLTALRSNPLCVFSGGRPLFGSAAGGENQTGMRSTKSAVRQLLPEEVSSGVCLIVVGGIRNPRYRPGSLHLFNNTCI